MATSHIFNGQTFKIPGVRSVIKSGVKNPPLALSFGTVFVIDTGTGANFGGGAGVNGTLAKDKDTFYEFDNIADYRAFIGGGLWWLLASPLFRPAGIGVNGVSKIIHVRAATTVPAELVYTFTGDNNGSTSIVNGGVLTVQMRNEGLVGNGVEVSSKLTRGFAATMEAGVNDTSKFILKFFRGGFTGTDQNSLPFDGIVEADTTPVLLAQSPEFDNIQTVIDWMTDDFTFNLNFKLKTSVNNGDGSVDNADLLLNSGNNLAAGGTESYTTANVDTILENAADLDISFILADDDGPNAQSANNFKIVNHAVVDSKFKPEVYIGAGYLDSNFAQSKLDAAFYNNDLVTVVHGGVKIASNLGSGFREYNSIYHAAAILGREAGLEPQVPITFKDIAIDGERHPLNDKLVRQALDAGLVVSRNEAGSFEIVKGVNSLQKNDFLVNEDGTTHSKQIKRIARQLNKEIIINAKSQLLKDPNGVNRSTLSELDVQKWLEGYLLTKIATGLDDNLILDFQDITVVRDQDAYRISYGFTPNSEISFLFFTGFILNV